MRAKLYSLHSPDVYDLESYHPETEDVFCLFIEILAGPSAQEGYETFGFTLCTPQWLINNKQKKEIISGRHHIIVFEYNYVLIHKTISDFISAIEEDTWNEVAEKIGRIAHWEFEDYRSIP